MELSRIDLVKYAYIQLLRISACRSHVYVRDFLCDCAGDYHLINLRDQIRRQYSAEEARDWSDWDRSIELLCESAPQMRATDPLSVQKHRLACILLGRMVNFLGWQGYYLSFVDHICRISQMEEFRADEKVVFEKLSHFCRIHPFSSSPEIFSECGYEYVGAKEDEAVFTFDLWNEGQAFDALLPTP
ncbi:hypothetical protein GGF50DRAFT_122045 [Schizophyllum commune]